eukprot:gnl/Trimastix_PCT/2584.p1 GENE.gnl/Trimastix_PCT/2584~~gnl/Trimastix_PCT/2584.p1  ORF type:complete len:321 (+),score=69.29 gnl/Trimastix_PCT/2584:114-1076(+)
MARTPQSAANPGSVLEEKALSMNTAVIFLKPHVASNSKVLELTKQRLAEKHVHIRCEGQVSSEQIGEKKMVDMHYSAIAEKGAIRSPHEIDITPAQKETFREHFGQEWDTTENLVNAVQFQSMAHCSGIELNAAYQTAGFKKLGGGFYVAKMTWPGLDKEYFVVNGFYPSMREKYLKPGEGIYWFLVEFEPQHVTWAHFRQSIIGATNPEAAAPESLRGEMLATHESLGFDRPSIQDNCVHASAGPLEGARERNIWCQLPLATDPFLTMLRERSVSPENIERLLDNPTIQLPDGTRGSVFDLTEDCDAPVAVDLIASSLE